MTRIPTLLWCSVLGIALAAQSPAKPDCSDGASIRRFVGPKKNTQALWLSLRGTKVPLWSKGEFHDQEFRIMGTAGSANQFQLVLFTTTWGQACRATTRLLVFDRANRFLGMYSGLDTPVTLAGGQIQLGSLLIPFTEVPPVHLGSYTWESADSIKSNY